MYQNLCKNPLFIGVHRLCFSVCKNQECRFYRCAFLCYRRVLHNSENNLFFDTLFLAFIIHLYFDTLFRNHIISPLSRKITEGEETEWIEYKNTLHLSYKGVWCSVFLLYIHFLLYQPFYYVKHILTLCIRTVTELMQAIDLCMNMIQK